jgi:uncharacterized protein (DUF433 family)
VARLKFDFDSLGRQRDPRTLATYTVGEAAHYLRIPFSTIRAWLHGTSYGVREGKRKFRRVIEPPDTTSPLLSFFNLAEAHVLRALRRDYHLPLRHVRRALDYVKDRFGCQRPLVEQRFQTDGVSLFIEQLGKLVDVSAQGQIVMRQVVEAHLERLEWEDRLVVRLYPFTRSRDADSPKFVIIDPRYSFGKPALKNAGVATAVIAERYKAGDSIDQLARDYGCTSLEIEEGLRCELSVAAAA